MTLVEVLVSVAILAVGTVVLMQALGRVSWAVLVGESERETLLFSFSKMGETEWQVQSGLELPEKENGKFSSGGHEFFWRRTIQSDPMQPELKSADFGVTWGTGSARGEYRVETLLKQPVKESS